MDNAGSSNEDEMVLHDDVKLSMVSNARLASQACVLGILTLLLMLQDLIAACHLPDETLLGLTTEQR